MLHGILRSGEKIGLDLIDDYVSHYETLRWDFHSPLLLSGHWQHLIRSFSIDLFQKQIPVHFPFLRLQVPDSTPVKAQKCRGFIYQEIPLLFVVSIVSAPGAATYLPEGFWLWHTTVQKTRVHCADSVWQWEPKGSDVKNFGAHSCIQCMPCSLHKGWC